MGRETYGQIKQERDAFKSQRDGWFVNYEEVVKKRDALLDKYNDEQKEVERLRNEGNKLKDDLKGKVHIYDRLLTDISLEVREAKETVDAEVRKKGAILNNAVHKANRLELENRDLKIKMEGMKEMAHAFSGQSAMRSGEGSEAKKPRLSGGR